MTNQVVRTISRKGEIAQAKPQRFVLVQRAAEQLSRRNVDQATTELLNEALARLTALCYERDATGHLCNVDAATGRVLVPLPWGKAGYAKWGLTPSEGNTMRRAWYLNMDFDGAVVLKTLAEWEIAIVEYRQARRR